jgi:2-phosphosulfolactate phosphatase
MRIDCISTISEALGQQMAGRTVIVIDALRATSTIAAALVSGASGVIPVETVAQARRIAEEGDLLAGERHCEKIPGFHLGNSPYEFSRDAVSGKRIVLTTTNGTRGIQKASQAATVLAGSFMNAAACAAAAIRLQRDVTLLCCGTRDVFALEDGLCAGLIVRELQSASKRPPELGDFAAAMAAAYSQCEAGLEEALLHSDSGIRLSSLGYKEDVTLCAGVNRFDAVPCLYGDEMKPF